MAEFSLNIYGENDEITKTFSTDRVRWGIFIQAYSVQEEVGTQSDAAQIEAINAIMKKLFPSLTEQDLENADSDDVFNTYAQVLRKARKIGTREKKAHGAV